MAKNYQKSRLTVHPWHQGSEEGRENRRGSWGEGGVISEKSINETTIQVNLETQLPKDSRLTGLPS